MCVPVKGGRGMFDNYKRVTFWSKWCLVNADGLHWHWPKYFYFGQHKFRSILGLHSTVVGSKTNVPPNLIKTVTTEAAIKKSEKLTSSTNSRLKNLSTKCISDLHFLQFENGSKNPLLYSNRDERLFFILDLILRGLDKKYFRRQIGLKVEWSKHPSLRRLLIYPRVWSSVKKRTEPKIEA